MQPVVREYFEKYLKNRVLKHSIVEIITCLEVIKFSCTSFERRLIENIEVSLVPPTQNIYILKGGEILKNLLPTFHNPFSHHFIPTYLIN